MSIDRLTAPDDAWDAAAHVPTGAAGGPSGGAHAMATWNEAIEEWRIALAAEAKSAGSIYLRTVQIKRLARDMSAREIGPWRVTTGQLIGWLGSHQWSRDTLRSHRAAVRTFYQWGANVGHIERSPALTLPSIKPAQPKPKPTPDTPYRQALAEATPSIRLALRLGAEAGLRRQEIAQVHARDLHETYGGAVLVVHGKGNKDRHVPLSESLAGMLEAACQLGGGYAFPGRINGHISPSYLGKQISALLPPGASTHGLRHRFATRAYGVEHDLFAVQELLGHASPETTRRYVQVGADRLRATINALGD